MFKYSKITVWSCFGAELDNGVQFQNQEGKGLNLNAQFTLELGLWDEKVEALLCKIFECLSRIRKTQSFGKYWLGT